MTGIDHRIGFASSSTDDVHAGPATIDSLSGWRTTDTTADRVLGGTILVAGSNGAFR